jgi:hypothetical protein
MAALSHCDDLGRTSAIGSAMKLMDGTFNHINGTYMTATFPPHGSESTETLHLFNYRPSSG